MSKFTFVLAFYFLHLFFNPIDSGAIQLDSSNIDSTLAENEFVFVNFYADWCRFSNMLAPIWDEAADKINAKFQGSQTKVVVGKVDCDKEGNLGTRFHITKYPTLKYVVNGELAKKEYRGQRSAEAFLEFVEQQTKDPVKKINSLLDLKDLDNKKRYVLGYFEDENMIDVKHFKKLAKALKDDCIFHAGYGETVKQMHPPGSSIVAFRPPKATSSEDDESYRGSLYSYDELHAWAVDKCTPMVREITFENAEELTEEGLPFLILFHHPDDTNSVKEYNDAVRAHLMEDKQNINFLIADGIKFAHPLHHLGKSKDDLPLIAIDSFRHMYLFPDYKEMNEPGKLKQFLQDLYSGKLHREFHYGPDKDTSSDAPHDKMQPPSPTKSKPPPSQFQHLGPSKNRYTLLHDEF